MCEENVHTGQFDYLRLVAIFLKPDSSVSSTSEWTHRSGRARSVLCGSTGPTTSRLTLPRMTTPRCGTTRGSSVCLKEVLSKYGWGTSENEVEKREREADKRNMDNQDVKLLQNTIRYKFQPGMKPLSNRTSQCPGSGVHKCGGSVIGSMGVEVPKKFK